MSEYVEYLTEILGLFGPITVRRMFGGYGIYSDGLMFALVADDSLYLKADAENAGNFEKKGSTQFEYNRNGKTVKLSYYMAPDEIFDDPELAAVWARRSFEAARRSQMSNRPGKTGKKSD